MTTLYWELKMGAAGDMLSAALLDTLPEAVQERVLAQINAAGIPGVQVRAERAETSGITGLHVRVLVDGVEEAPAEDALQAFPGRHRVANEELHINPPTRTTAGEDVHEHAHVHEHVHAHEHTDAHVHAYEHTHEHVHEHTHVHEHANGLDHAAAHAHDHAGGQGADHAHEHAGETVHHHSHDHDGAHAHDHTGHHHDHHATLSAITALIGGLALPNRVKADACAVYELIARAEGAVHGAEPGEVHFHEMGAKDAITDVVFASLLIHTIAPDRIIASPVSLGGGFVRAAHGVLPVPTPATALLLAGVPCVGGPVESELCTPTGAALIRHFSTSFGAQPVMTLSATGVGVGTKRFLDRPNCVRAFVGEDAPRRVPEHAVADSEAMCEFRCTLDDMTGEDIAFAIEQLFAVGARDAFTVPIIMKKGRPGIMLEAVCTQADKERVLQAIFKHTTTLGVREYAPERHFLGRTFETHASAYGDVRVKTSEGFGVVREKAEFEDLARLARENDVSLSDVRKSMRSMGR